MSLVQVQRSPSPSVGDESEILELDSSVCSSRNRTMSESYFAVRGAAVILPHSESSPTCSHSAAGVEIEGHLQAMVRLLRPQDTLVMAVRLQTQVTDHVRYLAVISTHNDLSDKRTLFIGMDYFSGQMTIGVVLPLLWCSRVELAGDGGVAVHGSAQSCSKADNALLFRPTSVQAMWYVFQFVHKELENARKTASRLKEPTSVTESYMDKISSPGFLCAQWQQSPLEDDEDYGLSADTVRDFNGDEAVLAKEAELRRELRQIMQSVDLDQVTSRDIRVALAERVGGAVDEHKEFVDREMLVILGQMEKPSEIFPYLLLGTEWNASNWEELNSNNVGYILNMTREVDNFFPQAFKYRKVWVADEANTQLLNHWNMTSSFIKEAKRSGRVCLVHCKKGISRSSSTVIAYVMKEYGWGLETALAHVKKRRNCITPNKGFMEQLKTYAGVLEASRNRHAPQFNAPRAPRAHSAAASCRAASKEQQNRSEETSGSLTSSSSSGRELSAVRYLVDNFERKKTTVDTSRHSFPIDIIKRNSIQQFS